MSDLKPEINQSLDDNDATSLKIPGIFNDVGIGVSMGNTHCRRGWREGFHHWRKRHIPDYVFLVMLGIALGAVVGVATYWFRWGVGYVASFFTARVSDTGVNWWLFAVPVLGVILTGLFTRCLIHTNLTHGVAQLIDGIKKRMFRIRSNLVYSPMVGATLTLGFGGTSGTEGPIACTGAAMGSNLGQLLGLDDKSLKILTGCGASAAICAIFMSPVGGLMFSLELLLLPVTTMSVIVIMTSCLVAYGTVFLCRGYVFDNAYNPLHGFDISQLPAVVALAVCCGLYCIYYSYAVAKTDSMFRKMRNPWISNILSGVIIGGIVFLFPSMFSVGYPVIGEIVHGNSSSLSFGSPLGFTKLSETGLMLCCVAILALKCWGVGATNSGGGVGGDFSPTLFAGAVSGYLFASFCNWSFGIGLSPEVFAFLGMAGVMSGAIEAPLMTIFIVMDLGQSYDYAVPIGVCAIVSYIVMKSGRKVVGLRHSLVKHHYYWKK